MKYGDIMDYGEMMDYFNGNGEFLVVHADIKASRSCHPNYNGLSYLSKVNGENLSMENAFLATVSCVDADLIHYPNTECSVTGCSLNFQNGIPGNWYSKMMSTGFVSTRRKACFEQLIGWGDGSVWQIMMRRLENVGGILLVRKKEKLCVPESRCTSIPNGEMVELASHVRVQKKKKEKSTHCRSGLGSVNFLVRKYG